MKPSNQQKRPLFLWGLPLTILVIVVMNHLNHVPQLETFMLINSSSIELLGRQIWPSITLLGDTLVLLCLMSPLLLLKGRIVIGLVAAIPAGGLASVVLKKLFSAPRPGDVLDPESFHVLGGLLTGKSFPSGHSITAFAACSVVYACLISARELQRSSIAVFCGTFLLATLVGLSRIAVGAHWPTDVIAGACIGWVAGLSGVALTHKFSAFFESTRMAWAALLLLSICSAFIFIRDYSEPFSQAVNQLAVMCVFVTGIAKTLGQMKFKYD